jgi:pimeloyl-ACP methyl ester carboxylesterase
MLVDLVQTATRDGVRLDAAFQAASTAHPAFDAAVCVHGTGSNFYSSTLFDAVAERLLALGISVLRVNTRGHDLMSTATTTRGGRRLGAAYEVLDDCRHDLAAWVGWLRDRQRSRLLLLGHSSGAVKCLYAQAHEPDDAVGGVVAVSPPRLSHGWFARSEKAAEFRATFQQAQALAAAGEPGALLDVTLPLPFVTTAAGYVEKYGPDERYNYLTFLSRVACPVLVTLGDKEVEGNVAFQGAPAAIAEVAPRARVACVAGADHFYTGVRPALLAQVEAWLAEPEPSDRPRPGNVADYG